MCSDCGEVDQYAQGQGLDNMRWDLFHLRIPVMPFAVIIFCNENWTHLSAKSSSYYHHIIIIIISFTTNPSLLQEFRAFPARNRSARLWRLQRYKYHFFYLFLFFTIIITKALVQLANDLWNNQNFGVLIILIAKMKVPI